MIKLSCNSCGAKLIPTEDADRYFCDHCGSEWIIPERQRSNQIQPVTARPHIRENVPRERKVTNFTEVPVNKINDPHTNEKIKEYLTIYRSAYSTSRNHLEMGRQILSQTRRLLDFLEEKIPNLHPDTVYYLTENLRQNTRSTVLTNVRQRKFNSSSALESLLFSCGGENDSYNLTKGKYPLICKRLNSVLSIGYFYDSENRLWRKK